MLLPIDYFFFPHYSQGRSLGCFFLVLAFCLKLVCTTFVLLNGKVADDVFI